MRSPKNSMLFIVLLFCFFSCLDAIIEKKDSDTTENPNTIQRQEELEKLRLKRELKNPEEPKIKKAKTKSADTLKPLIATSKFE